MNTPSFECQLSKLSDDKYQGFVSFFVESEGRATYWFECLHPFEPQKLEMIFWGDELKTDVVTTVFPTKNEAREAIEKTTATTHTLVYSTEDSNPREVAAAIFCVAIATCTLETWKRITPWENITGIGYAAAKNRSTFHPLSVEKKGTDCTIKGTVDLTNFPFAQQPDQNTEIFRALLLP